MEGEMAEQGVPGQAQGPVPQAQGPGLDAIGVNNIVRGLERVSNILGCQGVVQLIKPFDGNPKEYREWIRNIEKYRVMMSVNHEDCKILAHQSAKGAVGAFLQRYLADNNGVTWVELKKEMSKRFSDVTDQNVAFTMLRQVRQKGDNVQLYVEKILSLADDAFDDVNDPQAQVQLLDVFVNGLENDQLKMTILRKNPNTLEEAVRIATNENNLKYRIAVANGRSGPKFMHTQPKSFGRSFGTSAQSPSAQDPEPMDVSHSRDFKCYKCHKNGHRAKHCRVIQTVSHPVDIRCYICRKKGHIAPDCWLRKEVRGNVPMRGNAANRQLFDRRPQGPQGQRPQGNQGN